MIIAIWKNLWYLSVGKRSSSSFMFSLRCKPKEILSTYRKLFCSCEGKISTSSPPCFSGDIANIFLFWVIWACLIAHTQNDSINLQKTLMFICMTKIYFIIHLVFEILHFKESCKLIGWQHFGPWLENQNFGTYGIGGKISTTIFVCI